MNICKNIIGSILLLLCVDLFAQDSEGNAYHRGLSNSGIGIVNEYAVLKNPSAIAFSNKSVFGLGTVSGFALKELSSYMAFGQMPLRKGGLSFSFTYTGYEVLNNSAANVSYAKQLSKDLAIGLTLRINQWILPEAGNLKTFGSGLSLIYRVNTDLSFGTKVFNTIRNNTSIPEELHVASGLSWKFHDKFLIAGDISKAGGESVNFSLGIEYQVLEFLFLRSGFQTINNSFSMGAGFCYQGYRLNFSAESHPVLGYTPGIALVYVFE